MFTCTHQGGRDMDTKREGAKQGLPDGWTRWTIIVREELIDDLKGLAWMEQTTIKELVDEALTKYLDSKDLPRRKR